MPSCVTFGRLPPAAGKWLATARCCPGSSAARLLGQLVPGYAGPNVSAALLKGQSKAVVVGCVAELPRVLSSGLLDCSAPAGRLASSGSSSQLEKIG